MHADAGGVTYTRWGRKQCAEDDVLLLYSGIYAFNQYATV